MDLDTLSYTATGDVSVTTLSDLEASELPTISASLPDKESLPWEMTPKTTLLSRPGRHPQRLTLAKITIPGRERTAIYLYAYERTDSNQDEPTSFHVSKTEEWISSNREEIEFVAPFDRIPSSIGFSLKACTPFWYLAAYYFLTKQVIDRVNTPGNTNFLEELKVVFGQLTRPIEKLRAVPASHSVLGSPPRWEERAGYSAEANRRAKSIEASRGKKRAVESESGTTERGGTLHRKPGSRSKTPNVEDLEALLADYKRLKSQDARPVRRQQSLAELDAIVDRDRLKTECEIKEYEISKLRAQINSQTEDIERLKRQLKVSENTFEKYRAVVQEGRWK